MPGDVAGCFSMSKPTYDTPPSTGGGDIPGSRNPQKLRVEK